MSAANNLDWKIYESITKYIYETLGKKSGVIIKGYGNACKITGKSGVIHQIDVLTSHSDGIHTYDTAIECKYWKEKISKDIVMKVLGIIEDANINKGVIVSKSGFTQDGIDYAKYKNIGLVELREINNEDLDGNNKEINLGDVDIRISMVITRPLILSVEVGSNQSLEIKDEFDYYDYIITLRSGERIGLISYVNEFRKEIGLINKEGEQIVKCYKNENAILTNRKNNTTLKTDGITLTGKLIKIDASRTIQLTVVDRVWLIMKSIFEERIFSFTENGLIKEHKK